MPSPSPKVHIEADISLAKAKKLLVYLSDVPSGGGFDIYQSIFYQIKKLDPEWIRLNT